MNERKMTLKLPIIASNLSRYISNILLKNPALMKILCIGRNYVDHITELQNEKPKRPIFFMKPSTALHNSNEPYTLPTFTKNLHYELELVVPITHNVPRNIAPREATQYFDSIALGLDLTARDLQNECSTKGLPWEIAKAFDKSAIIGTIFSLTTLPPLTQIPFQLLKNGKITQDGNSSLMLWNISEIIANASLYFTLEAGDFVFTGTPKGVGTLQKGDFLEGIIAQHKEILLRVI